MKLKTEKPKIVFHDIFKGIENPRRINKCLKAFKIVQVKQDWRCKECNKKILYGSYCLGEEHLKLCLSCAETFIKDMVECIPLIKETSSEMEQKKDLYKSKNTLIELKNYYGEKKNG